MVSRAVNAAHVDDWGVVAPDSGAGSVRRGRAPGQRQSQRHHPDPTFGLHTYTPIPQQVHRLGALDGSGQSPNVATRSPKRRVRHNLEVRVGAVRGTAPRA